VKTLNFLFSSFLLYIIKMSSRYTTSINLSNNAQNMRKALFTLLTSTLLSTFSYIIILFTLFNSFTSS
jgi:hypothetical protein